MVSFNKNIASRMLNIKLLFYLAIFTLQDSSQEGVKSRFDDIIKSRNDKRNYRGLILDNEMKVLLISDPITDKSAASMNLNVGGMSDPPELQGLAHFCEHMLFLGTKKYPEQNDFEMFVSQNGGSLNAFTFYDQTNYHFDINPENLEGVLDRFAQFFIEPLFNESNVEREIKAIVSEYMLRFENDNYRLSMIDKFSADSKHPYSYFLIGNNESLNVSPKQKGIDVRKEVMKFYKKWYSANILTLSVLGKESLDELEQMVVKMFSNVENKKIKAPEWLEHPFNEEQFQNKWYVVPVKDIQKVIVTFPMPDLKNYFRSAPDRYLLYLLRHEGKGSLHSVLKKKGWITSFDWENEKISGVINFLNFDMDLTKDGLQRVDDIITLMYQYINMLKKEGPTQWIFDEFRNIKSIDFNFQEKYPHLYYVQRTAENLEKYPIREVLSGPEIFNEWNPELIQMIMTYLDPQKIRIKILSHVYENMTTEVEPWFQTKFKKERIPESLIKKWNNAGYNPEFKLPVKNEFIPTKFDLKIDNFIINKYPIVIKETPLMKVWFKQDDKFFLPKAYLNFHFTSPLAYTDPENWNNLQMFETLFKDSFTEYAFAANMADLNWQLSSDKYGMHLSIEGYDNKQLILLEKIMKKMMNFKIAKKTFEVLKEKKIQDLKNFETKEPYNLANYYLSVLLSEKFWVSKDSLEAIDRLTVESVRNFISRLFAKIHVECLIYGNVKVDEALKIATLVETKLNSTENANKGNIISLLPQELVLLKAVNLKRGYNYLYEIEDVSGKSFATVVYYQIGMQTTELNTLLELFTLIIQEPCYTVLRTNEQLGYIVFTKINKADGVQGLNIVVQSEKHPRYVEERISIFMKSMEPYIENMLDEEFNKYKESAIRTKQEKPKTMSELSDNFWNEITTQEYNFDRRNIELMYLKTITKDQILDFYENFIKAESRLRKKLSVHVVPSVEGGIVDNNDTGVTKKIGEEELILIKNINNFRKTQSLYPSLKSLNNTSKH